MNRTLKVVTEREQLTELVDYYMEQEAFAFDTETKPFAKDLPKDFDKLTIAEQRAITKVLALDHRRNQVFWISLATKGRADVIPMGHPNGEVDVLEHTEHFKIEDPKRAGQVVSRGPRKGQPFMISRSRKVPTTFHEPPKQLGSSEVFKALKPLMFSDKTKIGQNIQFDILSIAKYYDDEIIPGPYADTLVMANLQDENRRSASLEVLTEELLKTSYPQQGATLTTTTFEDAAAYSLKDAKYTWLLWKILTNELHNEKLTGVARLEHDLTKVFLDMKKEGVHLDVKAMRKLGQVLDIRMEEIQGDLWRANGEVFNLNSTAELSKFLFGVLKLEPTGYTKTGRPSTDKEALETLAKKDKDVAKLITYRKIAKVKSTYVDGLYPHILDGKISANFKQTGTVTGRISCSSPNLQNLPRTGDADDEDNFGGHIRDIFIPPEGYSMVGADYDQIELRAYAFLTQDPLFLATFENNEDPHSSTAANILKIPLDKVTPAQRNIGKTLSFAILYGAGPQTVAAQAKIGVRAAENHIKGWQETYRVAHTWNRELVKSARRKSPVPYVSTIMGRKRRLPDLMHPVDKLRFRAERQAVNSIVQGSSADLIKLAMVRLHEAFEGTPFKLVLTVHDELISIAPIGEEEECGAIMEEAMCGINIFGSVPLTASAVWGSSWAKAK